MDASAAVAILALEEDFADLVERLQSDTTRIWSAIARWETFRGLSRAYRADQQDIGRRIDEFEESNRIALVPISQREAHLALVAHVEFGRNNHPARLNMGDCFAYACAKAHGAKLLYKGDDFAKTDLA